MSKLTKAAKKKDKKRGIKRPNCRGRFVPWSEELANSIPRKNRLETLFRYLTYGDFISVRNLAYMRHVFNTSKRTLLPLEGRLCYVCSDWATDRHHVRPLCRGGWNLASNLVALCGECHGKMAVLNKDEGFRRAFGLKYTPVEKKEVLPKIMIKGSLSSENRVVAIPPPPLDLPAWHYTKPFSAA